MRSRSRCDANSGRAQSQHSEANGALMRVVPLAMWMGRQPAVQVAKAAKQDALLSHPSVVCQDANAAYAVAMAHLLTHPGNVRGAIVVAANSSDITSTLVKRWLLEDSTLTKNEIASSLNCTGMVGHVRHAFTLAFHFLRRRTSFGDALLETLQKGGDTDTSVAIVGGLMGALHSAQAIPHSMKNAVLQYDCSSKLGRLRPFAFSPGRFKELMDVIYPHQ
ncbi:hypothetical protein GOP47_0009108 [Adiantum capillus-veneris]|uniref:ADP-ribosylglycohydrolase n=1 Tax=Adiantum capillus-veneris TaxID=13818 RepID=A0A9D4V0I4_ADICA|nr:hypothetical protein GOP47_0009108 [Adiantum capillus-veneris]